MVNVFLDGEPIPTFCLTFLVSDCGFMVSRYTDGFLQHACETSGETGSLEEAPDYVFENPHAVLYIEVHWAYDVPSDRGNDMKLLRGLA